ncbi:MAG TPA: CPBP family intramembrane glutamic endopeptidase [Nocardioidaceae bacterium]
MRLRGPFARLVTGRRRQPAARTRAREAALVGTTLVVLALAVLNVVKHTLPGDGVTLSVVAALALIGFARWSGLSWEQLGLARERLRSGGVWAAAAVAAVAVVYLVGVLVPETRTAFLDSRYHMGVPDAVLTAFVLIPLRTVLFEEVAFRSVLWGMLSRHMSTWGVVAVSSGLFGLWHVLPSLSYATANQGLNEVVQPGAMTTALVALGTVLFTAGGGLVAAELRRRSGSVVASAGMHWATNALGVLFGLAAWRLAAG